MKKPLNMEKIGEKIKELIKSGYRKRDIEICIGCEWMGIRNNAVKKIISRERNRVTYNSLCPDCSYKIRTLTEIDSRVLH